jgi:hypothetical protein
MDVTLLSMIAWVSSALSPALVARSLKAVVECTSEEASLWTSAMAFGSLGCAVYKSFTNQNKQVKVEGTVA